jgi:hypothetical protein
VCSFSEIATPVPEILDPPLEVTSSRNLSAMRLIEKKEFIDVKIKSGANDRTL